MKLVYLLAFIFTAFILVRVEADDFDEGVLEPCEEGKLYKETFYDYEYEKMSTLRKCLCDYRRERNEYPSEVDTTNRQRKRIETYCKGPPYPEERVDSCGENSICCQDIRLSFGKEMEGTYVDVNQTICRCQPGEMKCKVSETETQYFETSPHDRKIEQLYRCSYMPCTRQQDCYVVAYPSGQSPVNVTFCRCQGTCREEGTTHPQGVENRHYKCYF